MILTDLSILGAIANGEIEIRPFDRERLGSNSYDLTLGNKLLVYPGYTTARVKLDCKQPAIGYREEVIPEIGYTLWPGNLYLGYTNEFTAAHKTVPMIEGKSSIGRLGIRIHATAGFGDIGFAGTWTLEIDCVVPVIIYPNMPIAQIYFVEVKGKCLKPYSSKKDAKYTNQQAGPVSSAMWKNWDKPMTPQEQIFYDQTTKQIEQITGDMVPHPLAEYRFYD